MDDVDRWDLGSPEEAPDHSRSLGHPFPSPQSFQLRDVAVAVLWSHELCDTGSAESKSWDLPEVFSCLKHTKKQHIQRSNLASV